MENENMQLPEEQEVVEETVTAEAVAEETAPVAETPANVQKGILLTPSKLVGLIVGVVVLVAVLVGAIVYGMGGFKKLEYTDAPETTLAAENVTEDTVPEETVPPTTPADTGADDVTHKGTYSVTDAEIMNLKDTVIATVGDAEMTNEDLQVYYWMQVQNFFSNYYYYLSYFGLDYTQPLDTQICGVMDNGYTWQQYFLEQALNNWHSYQAMANMAAEAGLELSEEEQEYLATLAGNIEANAANQGFATADELVQFNVGPGAGIGAYVAYEELFLKGDLYYLQQEAAIEMTDADIEAYFDANADYFAENGITKDGVYVDVRHVLLVPEGKNPGDEYTDEEWETLLADAQALLDQWVAGGATEDSFAELANQYSVDSDGTDGGLYEDVYEGQMVTNFNDWCFDTSRQYGDYDLVQTEYGYHLMFFVGSEPMWVSYAESGLKTELINAIVTDATEKHPMDVDYSAIALGLVDVSTWFGQ